MFRSHCRALATLSLVLVMTGCQSISLSSYSEDTTSEAPRAARGPTPEELERSNGRIRVVLLGVDATDGMSQSDRDATAALGREVEAALIKMGVEIVDRSLAARLEEELKVCEMQGRAKCRSDLAPAVAQYAVKPVVTSLTYAATAVPESRVTGGDRTALGLIALYGNFVQRVRVDGSNDQLTVLPHVLHSATARTLVKVYEIPSLREVKAVAGSGSREQRTAMRNSDVQSSLRMSAIAAGLPSWTDMAEVADLFAPKGYVIGRRSGADGMLFRISVGANQGVTKGMKVTIATEQAVEDPIAGKHTVDLVDVVEAEVTNLIEGSHAWVKPRDRQKAEKVAIGDRALLKQDKRPLTRAKEIFADWLK